MSSHLDRRGFIAGMSGIIVAAAHPTARPQGRVVRRRGTGVKLSVNAYSFNRVLRDGSMTLRDAVDFCADQRVPALDATGYYFPGYPEAPGDDYLFELKRWAYLNGVAISGTGVRNDFSTPDGDRRRGDVALVKRWIEVAAKLGAGVVRIFTGPRVPEGHSFERVLEWMVPDIRECARYGREHGVLVGIQNHHDFVRTAAETIRVVEEVDSDWCGVILDVGSLRLGDPYAEIERLLPYAVSWQLKETVWYGDREEAIDLERVKSLIENVGYRGYLPVETLGPGDPIAKVERFLGKVREVFPGV